MINYTYCKCSKKIHSNIFRTFYISLVKLVFDLLFKSNIFVTNNIKHLRYRFSFYETFECFLTYLDLTHNSI